MERFRIFSWSRLVKIGIRIFYKIFSIQDSFIYKISSYILGTALLGPKAAMACTVAVESVIVQHYNDQLRDLMKVEKIDEELLNIIKKFRDDEQEHHDIAIECKAEEVFLYDFLTKIIKTGSKCAIEIAKIV